MSRASRAEQKWAALKNAEYNLKARFEKIDWREDVYYPGLEDFRNEIAAGVSISAELTDGNG